MGHGFDARDVERVELVEVADDVPDLAGQLGDLLIGEVHAGEVRDVAHIDLGGGFGGFAHGPAVMPEGWAGIKCGV